MESSKGMLSSERQKRDEQLTTLESVSGWTNLAEEQKRYILASLAIQQRAERGTDPVSAARITTNPGWISVKDTYIAHNDNSIKLSEDLGTRGKYWASQRQVMIDYCHKAIIDLEKYATDSSTFEWSDAGPVRSYSDLENLITLIEEKHPFPFVIEIWKGNPGNPKKSSRFCSHSTLLLGRDADGAYIVWEKSGFHMPYRLKPLSQVYEVYGALTGWRIRPLHV